jgi:carbonic anhydrase
MNMTQAILLSTILATATPLFAEDEKPDTTLCEQGKQQSPVSLGKASKATLPALVADYKDVELTVERKAGLFAIHYPEGSELTIGDKKYHLSRITFHSPSEHSLRGQKFDLEVQMEHKDADGKIAVVSLMMKKGFSNFALNTLVSKIPQTDTTEPTIISDVFFSPQTLLPADLGYYTYTGSLTTPPCTEDVQWYVLKSYVELGKDQLAAFKKVLGNNARAIQPQGDRKILQN